MKAMSGGRSAHVKGMSIRFITWTRSRAWRLRSIPPRRQTCAMMWRGPRRSATARGSTASTSWRRASRRSRRASTSSPTSSTPTPAPAPHNLLPAGTNGPLSYQVVIAPGETSADFSAGTDQDGTPMAAKWDLKSFIVPGAIISIAHTVPGQITPSYEVYSIDTANMAATSGTITLTAPLRAAINPGDKAAVYNARVTGERRIESTFDAYTDEVLWSRSPLTDKRALGDP